MKHLYMKYLAGSRLEKKRHRSIADSYFSDVKHIVHIIRSHLPKSCERILDIGCGLGGIDVMLFREYQDTNNPIKLWLLDKNDDSPLYGKHYAGFHDVAAAYNSLDITRLFLETNGIPPDTIHLVNIDRRPFPSGQRFDIVISLLSWGFHFPIDVYLNDVALSLKQDGVLFIDVRKNTNGIERLNSVFRDVGILDTRKKSLFVVARTFYSKVYCNNGW